LNFNAKLGTFDSKTTTIGDFTLTWQTDGSGSCSDLTINSNGHAGTVNWSGVNTFGAGHYTDPFDGTTLDASNGYTSTLDSIGADSGIVINAISFDGASQLDSAGMFCNDSAAQQTPYTGGIVFGT